MEGIEEAPGTEGTDELPGIEGIEDAPGTEGTDEAPGIEGIDDAPGTEGADEAPGIEGIDDAPGTEGADEAPVAAPVAGEPTPCMALPALCANARRGMHARTPAAISPTKAFMRRPSSIGER